MGIAIKTTESNRIAIAERLFEVKTRNGSRGEIGGLCPYHSEKTPSFEYNYTKDAFFCFGCGEKGDLAKLWCDKTGGTFAGFCHEHGIEHDPDLGRKEAAEQYRAPAIPGVKRSGSSTHGGEPAAPEIIQNETWLKRAAALVEHAEAALQSSEKPIKWLKKRGITKKQAAAWRLGWLSDDRFRPRELWGLEKAIKDDGSEKKLWIPGGLVIPLVEDGIVRRIRIRRFGGNEPRYYVIPGSKMDCLAIGLPQRAAVVVESELDALMLAGMVGEFCAVVALGSSSARPSASVAQHLAGCAVVLVSLDFDKAGAKAGSWWLQYYKNSKLWPAPSAKDPGDAYAAGVDMAAWVRAGLPDGWFLGRDPVGLVGGRAAGGSISADGGAHTPEKAAMSPIDELAGLLRQHPVSVRVADGGAHIWVRENQAWARKNWETSKRISRLIFIPEVLDHLVGLGVDVVDSKTIFPSRPGGPGAGAA